MKLSALVFLLCIYLSNGVACKKDKDCDFLNSCVKDVCTHKELIPIAGTEWAGIMMILIIGVLGAAGGVGGTVTCTSLSLILLYFEAHSAVPLTQSFAFGGTLTTVVLKIRDRHAYVDRPMIYYDAIVILLSPALLGSTIGVLLNLMFPT